MPPFQNREVCRESFQHRIAVRNSNISAAELPRSFGVATREVPRLIQTVILVEAEFRKGPDTGVIKTGVNGAPIRAWVRRENIRHKERQHGAQKEEFSKVGYFGVFICFANREPA